MLSFNTRRCWLPMRYLAVAVTVLSAAALSAYAAGGSARPAIAADYAKIDAAISRRNLVEALSYCTPDFTQTAGDGIPEHLNEVRIEAQLEAKEITAAQNQTRILALTQTGKKAVVIIRQTIRVSTARAHMSETEKERDTWIDTPRGWRMQSSIVLSKSMGN